MTEIRIGGAAYRLPPVTIGRLEAINAALTQEGVSHIARSMNVVNAAAIENALTLDSEVSLAELKDAMTAVLVHAGFKTPDPKVEPPAAA